MSYFFIPLHFEKLERKDVMCEAARIANAKIAPLVAENERLKAEVASSIKAEANTFAKLCAKTAELAVQEKAQVVKYVARAGRKDSGKEVEDLEKAMFYLRREIELLNAARENREPCRPNQMTKKLEKGLSVWIRVNSEAKSSSSDWNPNYDWNSCIVANKPNEGYTEFQEVK